MIKILQTPHVIFGLCCLGIATALVVRNKHISLNLYADEKPFSSEVSRHLPKGITVVESERILRHHGFLRTKDNDNTFFSGGYNDGGLQLHKIKGFRTYQKIKIMGLSSAWWEITLIPQSGRLKHIYVCYGQNHL